MKTSRRKAKATVSEQRESIITETLARFIAWHTALMNSESDQQKVMTSCAAAAHMTGMWDMMVAAARAGAILNLGRSIDRGETHAMPTLASTNAAILYAYEFMAILTLMTVREVAQATGNDPDAYPEFDAVVSAFKARRWGAAEAIGDSSDALLN